MLIRLLPEQVSAMWDHIAPLLAEALPPTQTVSYQTMVGVLESILAGRSILWSYVVNGGGDLQTTSKALILTAIYTDPVVQSQHLMIYAIVYIEELTAEDWKIGFSGLRKYAAGLGLQSIIAYSAHPGVIKMSVERLGASAEFTLLEF